MQDELVSLLVNLRIMEDSGDDADFISRQFQLTDQNGDGEIDFEEFKVRFRLGPCGCPIRNRHESYGMPPAFSTPYSFLTYS